MTDPAAKSENEGPENNGRETQRAPEKPGRKLLLDLGPLVVFFAANYMTGDFMMAVQLLVVATVIATVVSTAVSTAVATAVAMAVAKK